MRLWVRRQHSAICVQHSYVEQFGIVYLRCLYSLPSGGNKIVSRTFTFVWYSSLTELGRTLFRPFACILSYLRFFNIIFWWFVMIFLLSIPFSGTFWMKFIPSFGCLFFFFPWPRFRAFEKKMRIGMGHNSHTSHSYHHLRKNVERLLLVFLWSRTWNHYQSHVI